MNIADLKAWCDENEETVLTADGFDDALLGLGQQFHTFFAVYDRSKCIKILMGQGMSEMDAEEYFEFNTAGAYVGEQTPVFVRTELF
jgi:hypothetical protein